MDVKLGGGICCGVNGSDLLDIRAGGDYSSRMSSGSINHENNGFRGPTHKRCEEQAVVRNSGRALSN